MILFLFVFMLMYKFCSTVIFSYVWMYKFIFFIWIVWMDVQFFKYCGFFTCASYFWKLQADGWFNKNIFFKIICLNFVNKFLNNLPADFTHIFIKYTYLTKFILIVIGRFLTNSFKQCVSFTCAFYFKKLRTGMYFNKI